MKTFSHIKEWFRTLGRQKRTVWVADFETTTKADDCRVWAWGMANVDTAETPWDVEMGIDMKSFVDRVSKMPAVVYFHNLAFDGIFLIDHLFRQGFEHVDKNPRKWEFSTLISNMGAFYSITVQWPSGHRTEFRDSLKKLPFKVSVVASAFNLPEAKGTLDYHAERPVGHKLTWAEKEYLASDVLIIVKALKTQLDSGMKKLTVGSDALAEFKKTIGEKLFDRTFPILSESMDAEIRKAYRGGWTYPSERFTGKITGSGRTYDVNSLYPSVMYNELLPVGMPQYVEGLPEATLDRPLFIVSVTFTAKLRKNHVPCIQVKGSSRFTPTEYQKVIDEPVTLSCTNVDLALWEEHYEMDILSYNGGWLFHGMTGVFKEYIDKWNAVKANSTGGMRVLAKLLLNSLYGKFATNPDITGKIPVYEDGLVKLRIGAPETREPVYTAMGVFITAYARDKTIRAAQENFDTFAYADTDSLHLLRDDDPKNLWIDPKALGAWKFEYAFDRALFVRAKTYIEHLNKAHWHKPEECPHLHDPKDCTEDSHGDYCGHGKGCEHETHVAGLPVVIGERLTIEDFVAGRTFNGKLNTKTVPGGIILHDVGFTLPKW